MYSKNVDKIIIVILTALILACFAVVMYKGMLADTITSDIDTDFGGAPSEQFENIFAQLSDGERLRIYVQEDMAYFFLPSYAVNESESLVLDFDEKLYSVSISGQVVQSGYSLTPIDHDIEINGKKRALTIMRSGNMPTIYINTADGNVERIDADKTETDIGSLRVVNVDGSEDISDGLDLIKTRGNSSFQADKKTYRIKLSHKQSLLGLDADRSFILQANAYDATDMRNAFAYQLAKEIGIPYVTDFRFADVYLNGEYRGNYIILEPVGIGNGRIDIARDGSYLFETVHRENRVDPDAKYFLVGSEVFFQVLHPKDISEQQFTYVQKHINRIDEMIEALKPEDSLEELSSYLDIESVVNIYLLDFLTNDIDCGSYSSFAYIDAGDALIHLGPVWDYDKAWGNELKRNGRYEFQAYNTRWPQILENNNEFRQRIKERLDTVTPVIQNVRAEYISELQSELSAAIVLDRIRNELPTRQSVNEGSFEKNILQLTGYFDKRFELLKDYTENRELYVRVYINSDYNQCFILKSGESLQSEQLEFLQKLFGCEEFVDINGEKVNLQYNFTEDAVIYAK